MKIHLLFTIFFSVFIGKFFTLEAKSVNKTLYHLTNETFEQTLKENPIVFVIFHRENRASKFFLKFFESLVEEQNKNSSFFPQILFAEIDLIQSIPFRTSHNITNFPLMKLYNRNTNKSIEYEGGRSEDSIKKWLARQFKEAPPLVKEIKTISELDDIIDKKIIVMAYFGPKQSENYDLYFLTAEKYPYYHYIFGFSIEIFEKFVGENYPEGRIMCFNAKDAESYTYDVANSSKKSLKAFYEGCSETSALLMDFETADRLFKGNEAFMILVVNSSNNESERALKVYKEAKITLGPKILMTIFDIERVDNNTFGFIENLFEITADELTYAIFLLIADRQTKPGILLKFKHFGGVYKNTIQSFYDGWKDKSIKPIYKNLIQKYIDPDEGPIKSINYALFNETVLSNENDVFLMIYARDCDACDRYKKIVLKIAEKYREISNLKFVMINGKENDVPDLQVKFVPSFYFYKTGSKDSPIYLEDHREEEKIIEFLNENLGMQWKKNEL